MITMVKPMRITLNQNHKNIFRLCVGLPPLDHLVGQVGVTNEFVLTGERARLRAHWHSAMLRDIGKKASRRRLKAAGYDPKALHAILLTHSHWDHVSALPDFPGVPVWVTPQERGSSGRLAAWIFAGSLPTSDMRSMGSKGVRT